MHSKLLNRRNLAAALTAVLLSGGSAEAGPFSSLAGRWEGSGILTISGGSREPIRCRAIYFVSDGGQSLRQILRCASDTYVVDVNADVVERAGQISGNWAERTSGASGSLSGYVRGDVIRGTISGLGISAPLSIVTHGRFQHASISLGASVAGVVVNFRRT
jgi:hypothetical protein